MKGILTFYLNFPDQNHDIHGLIETFRQCNKDLLKQIEDETGYKTCVVPTIKEACRIEKIDFDKPYPRFVPRTHIDLAAIEKRREEKAAREAEQKVGQ